MFLKLSTMEQIINLMIQVKSVKTHLILILRIKIMVLPLLIIIIMFNNWLDNRSQVLEMRAKLRTIILLVLRMEPMEWAMTNKIIYKGFKINHNNKTNIKINLSNNSTLIMLVIMMQLCNNNRMLNMILLKVMVVVIWTNLQINMNYLNKNHEYDNNNFFTLTIFDLFTDMITW